MKLAAFCLAFPCLLLAQSPQQDSAAASAAISQGLAGLREPQQRPASTAGAMADSTASTAGVYEILVSKPPLNLAASATSSFSWDTNPGFSAANEQEDTIFSQSLSVRYSKEFSEKWLGDISLQQLFYRYDALEVLNFDRSAVRASLAWTGGGGVENKLLRNWVPSVGAEVFRLYHAGDFDAPILDNTFLTLGLQRVFQANETHRLLVGLASSISLDASVEASQRDEHSLTAAWLARWAPRWESTLYARSALYDYSARQDWNNSVGLGVEYAPADWCRVGVNISASRNDSDVSSFSYQNLSVGASLNIRLSF